MTGNKRIIRRSLRKEVNFTVIIYPKRRPRTEKQITHLGRFAYITFQRDTRKPLSNPHNRRNQAFFLIRTILSKTCPVETIAYTRRES